MSIKSCQSYNPFLYPGSNKDPKLARLQINCEDGYKLVIVFYSPEGRLPENQFNPSTNTGTSYSYIAEYSHYIDLLRNETPLQITFNTDSTPPNFVIFSSGEPVGEEES